MLTSNAGSSFNSTKNKKEGKASKLSSNRNEPTEMVMLLNYLKSDRQEPNSDLKSAI